MARGFQGPIWTNAVPGVRVRVERSGFGAKRHVVRLPAAEPATDHAEDLR
jgi:hypothetical protein